MNDVVGNPQVNRCRTDLLDSMAVRLRLPFDAATTDSATNHAGLPICTRSGSDGRLVHIGYRLFSQSQREALGTTVCDFIERYTLQLDLHVKQQVSPSEQMCIDGVTATPMPLSAKRLAALCADSTVGIRTQLTDERSYSFQWTYGNDILATLSFPVDYNLLMGTDMDERERRLPQELQCTIAPTDSFLQLENIDEQQLHKAWNDNYYTLEQGHYLLKSLSANQYLERDTMGRLRYIFNPQLPVESLANLFTTGAVSGRFSLLITMGLYGFKSCTINSTPEQWLAMCIDEGCKPYFGLISMADDGTAVCELIMHNEMMGYNHVMRIEVPSDLIARREGTLRARLTAYVQVSKIRNLFEEYLK